MEGNVANISVKNIPDDLYERLKSVAEINRRSLNSEIIVCIEKAVATRRIDLEETLRDARQIREWTADYPIDDEQFSRAKTEGRP
jgi:hypothetical protein